MIRVFLSGAALCALMACQPAVPDSGAAAQRNAELARSPGQPTIPAPAPVQSAPLDPAAQPLPSSVTNAVNDPDAAREAQASAAATAANSGVAPVQASPSNPSPQQLENPSISNEQDFDTVSSQRTIESDAQRIASNRQHYRVIAPTELPVRPGTNQPNIVAYALETNNPVGTQIYRRSNFRSAQRHVQACATYPSPDQAQIDFLTRGGPQRDRRGLDPDGDGYACSWDPTPFRAARAPSRATASAPSTAAAPSSALSQPAASASTAQPAPAATPQSPVVNNPVVQPLVISTE